MTVWQLQEKHGHMWRHFLAPCLHVWLAARLGKVQACFLWLPPVCTCWCVCACVCCREREREREREPKAALRGSGLPCSSTSGLYIRPLINPEWRPGSDRLTGQAPVQDRAWFITTELQPALIYFRVRKEESRGRVFEGIAGVDTETALLHW